MSIGDSIEDMILATRFEGPEAVLRVSLDLYLWLKKQPSYPDLAVWSQPVVPNNLGVEVVLDRTLPGMEYRVDPHP